MTTFNTYKFPSANSADLLPGFAVNKILVGQEKISLTCAIRRPRDVNYENWLGSSEFNQYIKYYFIITPDLSEENLGKFHYADTRIDLITSNTYPTPQSPSVPFANWESTLGPKTSRPENEAVRREQKNIFNPYSFFGHASLSLDEILQNQFFIKDPLTAMENQEPIRYSVVDESQGYNTQFEVEIEYAFPLDQLQTNISILAFSHLDLSAMVEDFGIGISHHLIGIGSNSQLEQCLLYSEDGTLSVPRTRKAFFTDEGIQYRGPVHYHSATSPAPDGYIGFMSGPGVPPMFADETAIMRAQNRMMESAFKLSVREVPNTKVFSKIFIESALNFEGKPLSSNNSYSGYTQESVLGSVSGIDSTGLLSFGEEIQKTLLSQIGHIPNIDDNLSSLYQERLGKLTELSLKRGRFIFQGDVHSDISLETFSHNSIFFINIGDIVSSNSRLGHVYEMHRNQDNRFSQAFMEYVTFYSNIVDFTVNRIRLTNTQLENNAASSGIYGRFDKNEEAKLVIKSYSPGYGSDIASVSNSKAGLASLGYVSDYQILGIRITDYDLFDNYNTGNYKYEISMSIEDGICAAVKTILQDYRIILEIFTQHVKEASIPYLDQETSGYYNGSKFVSKLSQFNDGVREAIQREAAGASGNYNYKTQQFTPAFIEKNRLAPQASNDMVDLYCFAFALMTGQVIADQQLEDLKESIKIENTDLNGLEYFLKLCIRIESQLEVLAAKSQDTVMGTLNLGTHKRQIGAGSDYPSNIITVTGTPKVVARAAHENSLFAQPLVSIKQTEGDVVERPPTRPETATPPRRGRTSRRRRRRLAQRSEGSSFVAVGVLQKQTPESIVSRDGQKYYELQNVATAGAALPPEKKIQVNSKVKAAIEISKSAPIFGVEPRDGIRDELKEVENLLIAQGGTTLETLISESISDTGSEIDNKNKQESEFVTNSLKAAFVESVEISDNSKEFEKQIQSKYKDQVLKKEALGEAYETLKSVTLANKVMNTSTSKTSQKEKVRRRRKSRTNKIEKENKFKEVLEDETSGGWETFTFNEKGEKVLANDDGEFGILVYEKKQKVEQKAVPADTVKTSRTPSKSQPRSKPARITTKTAAPTTVTPKAMPTVSTQVSSFTPSGGSGGGY